MVRRNGRKSIEELYAPKIDNTTAKAMKLSHPPQSTQNVSGSNMSKRINTERDFGGFLITSNTPYNASTGNGTLGTPVLDSTGGGYINSNVGVPSSRRKSARHVPPTTAKGERYYSKEEKVFNLDDVKIDHNKAKTTRSVMAEKSRYNNPNVYDNKHNNNNNNGVESGHKNSKNNYSNHQSHHSHRHMSAHTCIDDDKDDDTEEFFELIRQTVEKAIGKSISDLLNRNFRELCTKIDRFSTELKSTNSLLYNIQTDINNKVVHYGEENSRHFRYLCMKSEYDKMFYQHQTMMTNNSSTPPVPSMPEKNGYFKGINGGVGLTLDTDKMTNINCASNHIGGNSSKVHSNETHKSSSNEHIITPQSSEVGMREILEHIQRFCTQVQMNGSGKIGGGCGVSEMKCDDIKNYRLMEESLKKVSTYGEDDEDDEEEEFQMSSDGMTPRSDDHDRMPKNKCNGNALGCGGNNSMRNCTTTRGGNGGGDA